MGTLATIIISLLVGATGGTFWLAILQNGSASVKRHAAAVKDYCDGKECWNCKFHSDEAPYCKVGYPVTWGIGEEEEA